MFIIEVDALSFKYSNTDREVLKNVSLRIEEGSISILAGPSGCGKTTLARSLVGLIPHFYRGEYSGRVLIDGLEVASTSIATISTKVGYVFQNPDNQIVMSTVERDIAFSLEFRGVDRDEMRRRVAEIMKKLNITHLANRRIETLSGGEKQLVTLAGVLVVKPRIIILDEPSAYLSPSSLERFINLIKELNKDYNITFLIIDHRLDMFTELTDKIFIMYDGKIILQGPPRQVFSMMIGRRFGVNIPTPVKIYEKIRVRGIEWRDVPLNHIELSKLILGEEL